MSKYTGLKEKIRKLETLAARGATEGEREAARAALRNIYAKHPNLHHAYDESLDKPPQIIKPGPFRSHTLFNFFHSQYWTTAIVDFMGRAIQHFPTHEHHAFTDILTCALKPQYLSYFQIEIVQFLEQAIAQGKHAYLGIGFDAQDGRARGVYGAKVIECVWGRFTIASGSTIQINKDEGFYGIQHIDLLFRVESIIPYNIDHRRISS